MFNEESTSRHHCTVKFNKETRTWVVMDSNGDRPSMNGTWYLADNVEIINNMMIRVGTTTFESKIQNN